MTDPISDMVARIKNAYLSRKAEVRIPFSKVKESIAKVMQEAGYVGDVSVIDEKPAKTIVIVLAYKDGQPVVTDMKRLSKPGLRRYSKSSSIPKTLGGYGLTIVSTSRGVVSDAYARKEGIGGELLCSIW